MNWRIRRVVSMSWRSGTFRSIVGPSARRVAKRIGRAEFFAPLISTVPFSGRPPSMTIFCMESFLGDLFEDRNPILAGVIFSNFEIHFLFYGRPISDLQEETSSSPQKGRGLGQDAFDHVHPVGTSVKRPPRLKIADFRLKIREFIRWNIGWIGNDEIKYASRRLRS